MERFQTYLLGLLTAVAVFLLMGAYSGEGGRYQLAASAEENSVAVFVMDKATGVTKLVFFSNDGDHKGQLGESFEEMEDNYHRRR